MTSMNNCKNTDGLFTLALDKLREYGQSVFETRELLDLLLLSAMPECDAPRLADSLLRRFSSLEGIFTATDEELLNTEGVDQRTVSILKEVGRALEIGELSHSVRSGVSFESYDKMGAFFVKYLSANRDTDVAVMLLDNRLRLIKVVDVPVKKYGSAAMKPR